MIDRRSVLRGLAALPLLGTAAALLLATTATAPSLVPDAVQHGPSLRAA